MSTFHFAGRHFYWRTNPEISQPIVPFNFQHWMSHSRFEQIVSYHTLMMPNKLDAPNFNDPLYSVCSFINAFNSNLIEPNTAAYVLRLTRPWFGSRCTIVGNSWFGSPKLCLLLMEN
ncbi:13183_t:CDS:2, partial [Gigaspora rosea]